MCVEPLTIFTVVSAASALVSGYAQVKQGQAEKAAARYNAAQQRQNAEYAIQDQENVRKQALLDRRRRGIEAQQALGDLNARAGAMGVDASFGTFDDLASDIKTAYRIDKSILGQNEKTALEALDREAAGYRSGAALSLAQGESAERAGYIGAVGSLLDAGATISSRWIMPKAANANAPGGVAGYSGYRLRTG